MFKAEKADQAYQVQKPEGANKTSATDIHSFSLNRSLTAIGKVRIGCCCVHTSLNSTHTVLWEPPFKVASGVLFPVSKHGMQKERKIRK